MKLHVATALLGLAIGTTASPLVHAAQWHATVGAQSHDMGRQAMAFLPNEIWIHAGDSITWTFDVDEIHTVTFLIAGEVRPPFPVGCPPGPPPGITPDGSSFDGTHCVNTGPLVKGHTYTVNFPSTGNFKLVCLVHGDMTGTVHVLDPSLPLPHNQAFYDEQAADAGRDLLADVDHGSDHDDGDRTQNSSDHKQASGHGVIAGIGEVSATAGGHRTLSVMRFMHDKSVIHVGDTVEWNNADPITPHTITFGPEPTDLIHPSGSVPFATDADGALHASISSLSDNVHSGFIVAEPQERTGLAQAPLGHTRFRVTFTHAGTYPYKCALHDNLGMMGQVVVKP
ncbi:cupredoxin domain-containing protein [Dokdonella soli]|uniref:Blue (type 1) copper domain-containing protein n=1 Tax=Dokdonella soli TaxID=529810 RepID=A0ABP3TU72_9GAMM